MQERILVSYNFPQLCITTNSACKVGFVIFAPIPNNKPPGWEVFCDELISEQEDEVFR
jgi:hypothetical protein